MCINSQRQSPPIGTGRDSTTAKNTAKATWSSAQANQAFTWVLRQILQSTLNTIATLLFIPKRYSLRLNQMSLHGLQSLQCRPSHTSSILDLLQSWNKLLISRARWELRGHRLIAHGSHMACREPGGQPWGKLHMHVIFVAKFFAAFIFK